MTENYDIVIIGAGIVGLTVAREIKQQFSDLSIVILEKEGRVGDHASGRNSGILHSGIYYPKNSLKAQFCTEGAKELSNYCETFKLPICKTGKILLPIRDQDENTLDILHNRALANGAQAYLINDEELKKLEPHARVRKKALYTPDTAVVEPSAILQHLSKELFAQGIQIQFHRTVTDVHPKHRIVTTTNGLINYGYLFNCAGVHAERIAKKWDLGKQYAILPFKGSYFKLRANFTINHQLYPVPDMTMPFLGIHITKNIHDDLFLGPTATPVFGREHYQGLRGVELTDIPSILRQFVKMYWRNRQNFRKLVHEQAFKNMKTQFLRGARQLIPEVMPHHLHRSKKVGIRAQLINTATMEFVHDFVVLTTAHSTHVLNAISPAFTSSFPFSKYLVANMLSSSADSQFSHSHNLCAVIPSLDMYRPQT